MSRNRVHWIFFIFFIKLLFSRVIYFGCFYSLSHRIRIVFKQIYFTHRWDPKKILPLWVIVGPELMTIKSYFYNLVSYTDHQFFWGGERWDLLLCKGYSQRILNPTHKGYLLLGTFLKIWSFSNSFQVQLKLKMRNPRVVTKNGLIFKEQKENFQIIECQIPMKNN